MARQNTRLESEGAEFLVLGNLLIRGIHAYKAYTNTKGYDVVAVHPDKKAALHIQVKSRWSTGATGFIIRGFECDFVVACCLNRGSTRRAKAVRPPEFFVFPVEVVSAAPRTVKWGKVLFRNIENCEQYRDRWDLIEDRLRKMATTPKVVGDPPASLGGATGAVLATAAGPA